MAINISGLSPLLQVFDMPTAIRFYRDTLGFEVAEQSQPESGDDCDWALLRLNGIELMLNTAYEKQERPPAPDPVRIAVHADIAIYFGCPDVDAAYSHLIAKEKNIKKPVITSYGWKALSLIDPDGYHLCFHWPVK